MKKKSYKKPGVDYLVYDGPEEFELPNVTPEERAEMERLFQERFADVINELETNN